MMLQALKLFKVLKGGVLYITSFSRFLEKVVEPIEQLIEDIKQIQSEKNGGKI